jgi:xylulokinase
VTTRYLLGVDIGTSSCKGVLVREDGVVVASAAVEHLLEIPRPGWAEHDAETAWWDGFLNVTRSLISSGRIDPRRIAGIGFSAISPAILPIDRGGRPLRKAILYGIDTRATQEAGDLQQIIDGSASLRRSGVRLSSQSAAPKVLWIRLHEPAVWDNTHLVVNGSGFLLYRLTGNVSLDVYDAAGFAPFVDVENCCWTADTSEHISPSEKLPRITWSCDIAGRISAEGARLSGLVEGTPVITGTADAAAEAVSAGVARPGDMMVMYGSSVFFILRTRRLCTSPYFWCAPFLENGTYVLTGGMSTAGSLTRWFRDQFAPEEMEREKHGGRNAFAALADLAAGSRVGANGVVMLPYFAGERTPILDPDAKGLIFGLSLSHTRADVYRALLESVGFGIRHNLDRMREEGACPERIMAVGGGTRNPLWMQIVSDIAGIEQHIPEQRIGAAYGDAFLAGVGTGLFSGIDEVGRWVRTGAVVRPEQTSTQAYDAYYKIYRSLYEATAPLMKRLTCLVSPIGDGHSGIRSQAGPVK